MNHQPNTPASLNEAVADERALFESHIVAEGYNAEHWLQRWRVGDAANKDRYIKDWVQTAWEAWKKRAALAAPGAAIDAREQEPPETISANLQVMRRFTSMWHADAVRLGYDGVGSLLESLTASRQEAPPASAQVSAELNGAVASLQAAVIFTDQMRAAATAGEDVTATGVARDAREWLERAARALIDALSKPATPSEALSPATVAQPVALTDAELGAVAYKGFDDYWTEDSPGKERDAWTASAKAVLKLAQPCASQGCGGAVQEAVASVVSCWNRFRWSKETSDAVSALAALSTAPRSLDGATPGGKA